MRISQATTSTALRNDLRRIDVDTGVAPLFHNQPTEKKSVALRVVDLSKRYGSTIAGDTYKPKGQDAA